MDMYHSAEARVITQDKRVSHAHRFGTTRGGAGNLLQREAGIGLSEAQGEV